MREYEEFCEVRVLTYCVMSNHFHILLEVPRPPEIKPSAEVILAKLARLTGHQDVGAARQQLDALRQRADAEGERQWLERYYARMWDVSAFMKLLKQRFTQWYNARFGRRGTLWEDRFKSVLVDGAGSALVTMAAYIDLNPVRAKLHDDPKEYRWSGYGEAMAGRRRAREGLQTIVTALAGREENLHKTMELYRMHVYNQGHEGNETRLPDGSTGRGALAHAEVLAVLAKKGRVALSDYLGCRVRYFCDGAVFGSREFVDDVFRQYRARFGENRRTGARRMRGLEPPFYALRDLQVRVFG
jgi:REP element-mobilizing transposase RayT